MFLYQFEKVIIILFWCIDMLNINDNLQIIHIVIYKMFDVETLENMYIL